MFYSRMTSDDGCSGTPLPRLRTVMVWGRKSPVGSKGKAPVGGLDWGRSPQKLKRSY